MIVQRSEAGSLAGSAHTRVRWQRRESLSSPPSLLARVCSRMPVILRARCLSVAFIVFTFRSIPFFLPLPPSLPLLHHCGQCTFVGNDGHWLGGAVICMKSDLILDADLFNNNFAVLGGAITLGGGTLDAVDTDFYSNIVR